MTDIFLETHDPLTGRSTVVEKDGKDLLIVHHQNTKPIVESAKAIASNFDPLVRRDTIHVARIPLNVWRNLERLGITKDQKAFNKWLNDRDNAVFRTDNRSKL